MSTTALTIVNSVLARLRESQTSAGTFPSSTYAQLILRLVNETKIECETAWDWTILRRALPITTVIGTNTYTLTGAGQRYRFYDRAKRIYNTTNRTEIFPYPQAMFDELTYTASTNNQMPCWYKITGADAAGDPTFTFYPTPDAIYTLQVPLVIPEADLVLYTDTFSLPQIVIELGAWARAISERGEDGGTASDMAWRSYQASLSDHIAIDAPRVADETIWVTV